MGRSDEVDKTNQTFCYNRSCDDLLYTILCYILAFASISIYLHALAEIIICLQTTVHYMKLDICLFIIVVYIQALSDFCYVFM